MKLKKDFIRKVYRLGIVDTRNFRYCFNERSRADGRFPAVVRFRHNDPYGDVEELTIYDVDILY